MKKCILVGFAILLISLSLVACNTEDGMIGESGSGTVTDNKKDETTPTTTSKETEPTTNINATMGDDMQGDDTLDEEPTTSSNDDMVIE